MKRISTLLLSGGAMRGIAYVGVFKKLRKVLYPPARVAGVSIGSAFGLLWILGYSYTELRESILSKAFKELHRFKIGNVMTDWGLDTGDGLRYWLSNFLERKGFLEKVTFKELYERTGVLFGVFATDLITRELFLFDKNSTPNTIVLDAIMASMSIPFLFTCKKLKIGDKIVPFVDGAVISNLPVAKLLESWNVCEEELLALKLVDNNVIGNISPISINSISEYLLTVSRCISTHIHKENCKNLIEIDISDMPHIDLNMSIKTKKELMKRGVVSVQQFIYSKKCISEESYDTNIDLS